MNNKITIVFISLLLFVSCMDEMVQERNEVRTFDTFYAVVESPAALMGTKVHIEDLTKVKWNEGDEIGIYSDVQAPVKYVRNKNGQFVGEPVSGTVFYAFYPYNSGNYDAENPTQLNMTLKSSSIPMVAMSQDNKLSFRQTVGLLHFRVRWNKDLLSAYLYNKQDSPIVGEGCIDMTSNTPSFVLSPNGDTWTSMGGWKHKSYPDDEEGYMIYEFLFSVPEMVMEQGFTVYFVTSEASGSGGNLQYVKSTNKPCVISRGKIKTYELVDIDAELIEDDRIIDEEREALMAFYNALDGEHWINNTNWGSEEPIYKWFGVSVLFESNEHGYKVHSISLPSNNLKGVIPEEIGNLSGLGLLTLDDNSISGELPKSLSNLKLGSFNCRNNQLTGPLLDISGMPDIYSLCVSDNSFTGSIPANYSIFMDRTTYTKELDLKNNCLSGPLPSAIIDHPNFPTYVRSYLAKQKKGFKIEIDEKHFPAPRGVYKTLAGEDFDLGAAYAKSDYTLIIMDSESRYSSKPQEDALRFANKYIDSGLQVFVSLFDVRENHDYHDFLVSRHYDSLPSPIIASYEWSSGQGDYWPANPTYGGETILVNRDGDVVFIDSDLFKEYSFGPSDSKGVDYYLGKSLAGEMYESKDYSKDGTLHVIQSASEGKGINIVIMGSYFSDRLIDNGDYQRMMEISSEAFFKEEPFKTYRNLFNVYSIDVVSKNEVVWGETALCTYDEFIAGDLGPVFEYLRRHLTDEQIDDTTVIFYDRRERGGGGRCAMFIKDTEVKDTDIDYACGTSIGYVVDSFGDAGDEDGYYTYLVQHEAGGHGFGKLLDEYWTIGNGSVCPDLEREAIARYSQIGFYRNVDITNDVTKVKWSKFLSDPRYASEGLGCYEGADHYEYGIYRPSVTSIMRSEPGTGFNAPSRYAIWYRIHKLAYGDEWQGTYEDFVEYDKVNRTPAAVARRKQQRRNFVEKDFEPLAPPVIIPHSWRNEGL